MMRTFSQGFPALRMEINAEYDHLTQWCEGLKTGLSQTGRAAVITFHSGEDRLVKQWIKSRPELFRFVPKKVIHPTQAEIRENRRAHSAKLRCILHTGFEA